MNVMLFVFCCGGDSVSSAIKLVMPAAKAYATKTRTFLVEGI